MPTQVLRGLINNDVVESKTALFISMSAAKRWLDTMRMSVSALCKPLKPDWNFSKTLLRHIKAVCSFTQWLESETCSTSWNCLSIFIFLLFWQPPKEEAGVRQPATWQSAGSSAAGVLKAAAWKRSGTTRLSSSADLNRGKTEEIK